MYVACTFRDYGVPFRLLFDHILFSTIVLLLVCRF